MCELILPERRLNQNVIHFLELIRICIVISDTVKPVLRGHSKIDQNPDLNDKW